VTEWRAPSECIRRRMSVTNRVPVLLGLQQRWWGARIYTIGLAGGVRHVVPGTERTRERKSHG